MVPERTVCPNAPLPAPEPFRPPLLAVDRHLLYPAEQEDPAVVTPFVLSAYLSEYLVSHLLLTGTYFCKNSKIAHELKLELSRDAVTKPGTPNLWALRETLLGGCIEAVLGYAGMDPTASGSLREVLERIADFSMLARQCAFFMTDKYREVLLREADDIIPREKGQTEPGAEYTAQARERDLAALAEMVKLGIISENDKDKVEIDTYADGPHRHAMRHLYVNGSWDKDGPRNGWGADLGTYNGQMPIKEFEKLAYRLVPYLMMKHLEQQRQPKERD